MFKEILNSMLKINSGVPGVYIISSTHIMPAEVKEGNVMYKAFLMS